MEQRHPNETILPGPKTFRRLSKGRDKAGGPRWKPDVGNDALAYLLRKSRVCCYVRADGFADRTSHEFLKDRLRESFASAKTSEETAGHALWHRSRSDKAFRWKEG